MLGLRFLLYLVVLGLLIRKYVWTPTRVLSVCGASDVKAGGTSSFPVKPFFSGFCVQLVFIPSALFLCHGPSGTLVKMFQKDVLMH